MKLIPVGVALFIIALNPAAAEAPPGPPPARPPVVVTPAYVNQLAEELRTNHPALRAARARIQAADAGVRSVRVWEDPQLRLGAMIADRGMRAEDGDLLYGVEQKLPLFGKPQLARRVAEAELTKEQANGEYEFQQQRRTLAQALFRTARADRVVEVSAEDLHWLQTMVQSTEQRYRAGESTLVDLLRIQNEQSKQTDQLRTDQQNLEHEHLALNRLLNRDLQSPWPPLHLPPLAGPIVFSPRLVNLALQYEPRLKVLQQEVGQAQATARLTKRQRLPEVTVGALARNYSGNGEFRQAEVVLGVSLPLGNASRYRSDYERDQARATAAEQMAADYAGSVREDVHRLTVQIDAARREAVLYRDEIIPRSESARESAQAAWQAGRGLFNDVLEARRMLLEARLQQARAVAEQYQLLSELVLCCGLGDLEALPMIGASADAAASYRSQP
jgi:outer membrane protein, heavy metal efflux system